MRAVVQRVASAQVFVDGSAVGAIGRGLAVLLGVGRRDGEMDAEYIARKVLGLRVFDDDRGRMNRSVVEVGGALLVVSQFTLFGDCRRGRRPAFDQAAPPEEARALYEATVGRLRTAGLDVRTGVFQASMALALVNDGPVTLLLDSARQF